MSSAMEMCLSGKQKQILIFIQAIISCTANFDFVVSVFYEIRVDSADIDGYYQVLLQGNVYFCLFMFQYSVLLLQTSTQSNENFVLQCFNFINFIPVAFVHVLVRLQIKISYICNYFILKNIHQLKFNYSATIASQNYCCNRYLLSLFSRCCWFQQVVLQLWLFLSNCP